MSRLLIGFFSLFLLATRASSESLDATMGDYFSWSKDERAAFASHAADILRPNHPNINWASIKSCLDRQTQAARMDLKKAAILCVNVMERMK